MPSIQTGDFVHVVATVKPREGEGKILYVNPSNSTVQSDAEHEPGVELLIEGADGEALHRETVVVRRSSCEGTDQGATGLIQADLPRQPGMKSIALLVNGKEVSRYDAGAPSLAPTPVGPNMGLAMAAGEAPHRLQLTLGQLAGLQPVAGVTYSVQVKPDTGGPWNTIAVGRPTPRVDIDRSQFAGAKKAQVRVLRTNGFDEDVIAEDSVDLF